MSDVDNQLLARLKARTIDDGGCWIWQGSAQRGRQAMVHDPRTGQVRNALRVTWECTGRGELPQDRYLVTVCESVLCINPEHAKVMTRRAMMRHYGDRGVFDKSAERRLQMRKERTHKRKLSDEDVAAIRACDGLYRDIAARFGVSPQHVGRIKSGERRATLKASPWAGLL